MINALLTFDYELFFGFSGSVENNIIKPTDYLLDILENYNYRAIFFVDALCLYRLYKENDLTFKDAIKIKEQLKNIVKKNHRIELHIHPHWLDAKYNNGFWDFSNIRHYRIHTLNNETIKDIFQICIELLNNIAREVNHNYNIIAYRAGGYCVLPFEELIDAFTENGIIVDSSILPRMSNKSEFMSYSYNTINNGEYYKFSKSPDIQDKAGIFYEFPIYTYYDYPLISKACKILYRRNRIFKNGHPIKSDGKKIIKIIRTRKMISIDDIPPIIFKAILKKINLKILTFISHPKSITNYTIDNIRIMYEKGIQTITYKDIISL